MAQIIIFENENGGVSVCTPTGEISIEEVLKKDCPNNAIIVDSSILPNNTEFFKAWELNGLNIIINLNKAKEITKDKLRIQRLPLLQAQDVAFQRAIEENVDTTAIVAEKQRLRDITKLADSATTLEELKELKAS